MLLAPGRKGGGVDERARPVAAIYDPELTVELPLEATVGTAMNALAHCAEAYYHPGTHGARRAPRGYGRDGDRRTRCRSSSQRLDGIYGRTRLLEGAMRAAFALADSGLCLGHAMAQALGGRYGLPQGSTNAVCLPAALRFNAVAVPDAVARFARGARRRRRGNAGSRSWRGSAASSGCATSASPRPISTTSRRPSSPARARRRIPVP